MNKMVVGKYELYTTVIMNCLIHSYIELYDGQ